jgi:hypothetical protein
MKDASPNEIESRSLNFVPASVDGRLPGAARRTNAPDFPAQNCPRRSKAAKSDGILAMRLGAAENTLLE